jgi:hypothetical protein
MAAAHEVDNFVSIAGQNRGLPPFSARKDAEVTLDGDAVTGEPQMCKKARYVQANGDRLSGSVDGHLNAVRHERHEARASVVAEPTSPEFKEY